jgi:hypothetical protein
MTASKAREIASVGWDALGTVTETLGGLGFRGFSASRGQTPTVDLVCTFPSKC